MIRSLFLLVLQHVVESSGIDFVRGRHVPDLMDDGPANVLRGGGFILDRFVSETRYTQII